MASALAIRTKAFRFSLAMHWELGRSVGCHYPRFRDQLAAAQLVGLPGLRDYREARDHGNWARHSRPPGAQVPCATPLGIDAASFEAFRRRLYEGQFPM